MSKRGQGPALYEKIRSSVGERAPMLEPIEHSPPVVRARVPSATLGGGRIVRMPVGYAWLGAAGMVVLVILSYVLGYSRGEHVGRRNGDSALAERLQADELLRATADPLNNPVSPGTEKPVSTGTGEREAAKPGSPPAKADAQGDPRQPGLNYFILMHADKAGARRFVDFCREEGLDARAVPVNNGRSFQVIVLPGHAAQERSSDTVKKREQKIIRVTSKWREQTREVLTPYPAKYSGP